MDDSSVTSDVGSAANIGLNAATGNWIGAAVGAIGLGASLFGGLGSSSAAKQQAQASSNIAGLEGQENQVRQQAMQMSASRQQLQILRQTQQARAMALNASTGQGGGSTLNNNSSGIQGGLASVDQEGNFAAGGVRQQLQFGNQMFGLDAQITQQKMLAAQSAGTSATMQGISSIGGALTKSSGTIGNFAGNVSGSLSNGLSNLSWLSGGPTGFLGH